MMNKKALIVGLMLTALTFATCQEPCNFGLTCQAESCVPNLWLNAATVIIVISFALIAIIYMIGTIMDNPKVIHWSKTEFYELIGTAVILALYLSLLAILNDVIGPAFYGSSIAYPGEVRRTGQATWATVEGHVMDYTGTVRDSLIDALKALTSFSIFVGSVTSFTLLFDLKVTLLYLNPFGAFASIQQAFSAATAAIGTSILQLEIQRAILGLSSQFFSILLPLGIALRAFPLTRPTGGALIAIAIGFTIILMVFYLFVEDISLHYYDAHCGGVRPSASKLGDLTAYSGEIGNMDAEHIQQLISEKFAPGGYFSCVTFLVLMEAAVLPLAGYLIMLNITRRIAEILGAHIDFSTLVRFI